MSFIWPLLIKNEDYILKRITIFHYVFIVKKSEFTRGWDISDVRAEYRDAEKEKFCR